MASFSRQVPGSRYDEIYLSASFTRPATEADVDRLVDELGAVHVLRVVVLGDSHVDPARPGCVLAGHQYPHPSSSIEVYAIRLRAGTVVTALGPGAWLIESGPAQRRLVCAVGPQPGGTVLDQAQSGLYTVERWLAESGLAPRHLERTWYFVDDIGTTYGELNKARDEAFDRWGLTSYPASTGIGATLPGPARIGMLAEAYSDGGEPVATPFDTTMQCPPSQYGPRFARANRIRRNGTDIVNISGISHIDERGESIQGLTAPELVDYTMASLADLLATAGVGFADIASCYVYCKDAETLAAYRNWLTREGVTLPDMVNFVDVCRPELRFEIEARAVRPDTSA
jgi:enamine deaminase RidA (YjgF/YER057c/UK114 family)